MSGISTSLPLRKDPTYPGFALNITMLDVVKQNFKNLVLTSPGERIMIPEFGVGIRNYLFEVNDEMTYSAIRSKITSQVAKYMPFITIQNIDIRDRGLSLGDSSNSAQIVINYQVASIGLSDALLIEI